MSRPDSPQTPTPGPGVVILTEGPDRPARVEGGGTTTWGLGGDDILPINGLPDSARVFAGAGHDAITGYAFFSLLDGGPGNDTIEGSAGSDLCGGTGDDLLLWRFDGWLLDPFVPGEVPVSYSGLIDGGAGDDTLRIEDFHALNQGNAYGDLTTRIEGGAGFDRLELALNAGDARFRAIEDGFEIDGVAVRGVEEFVFADATLDRAQMAARAALDARTGTEGDDYLQGTPAAEAISGLGGDDWILPGGGRDSIDGGPGHDMLSFVDRRDGPVQVQLEAVDFESYYATRYRARVATGEGDLQVSGIEGVTGTSFNDRLTGSQGANHLRGFWGNDRLEGLGGADRLDGGPGTDTASYALAAGRTTEPGVTVSLLAGRGWYGDAAGDRLSGIENLMGSSSYDTLTGDHGANALHGGFGTEGDILIGNGGDDTLTGGDFNNPDHAVNGWNDVAVFSYDREMYEITTRSSVFSYEMIVRYTGPGPGDGTDTLINIRTLRFADGDLNLLDQSGTAGDDSFYGLFARTNRREYRASDYDGAHNMHFEGGAGDDTYHAGSGIDTIDGGAGSDWVDYSGRHATVVFDLEAGYALSTFRSTLISVENAIGSDSGDVFHGSGLANRLIGNGGNDLFYGSWGGRDHYDGGSGEDMLSFARAASAVSVSLLRGTGWRGQAAQDEIRGIEHLTGSAQGDALTGDHGYNVLQGEEGDDTLMGNAGDDMLYGGAGRDLALFGYNRADYDVQTLSARAVSVEYIGAGPGDGRDVLHDIEMLRFADGDMIL